MKSETQKLPKEIDVNLKKIYKLQQQLKINNQIRSELEQRLLFNRQERHNIDEEIQWRLVFIGTILKISQIL